jgi:hypothetical protein
LVAPLAASGPAAPPRPAATAPPGLGGSTTVEATQPQAVAPQEVRARRAVSKAPPSSPPRAGDLICGECGEANAPTRRFCSRCGASLATAEPVRVPWWRKLLPARRPKTRKAGERPGQPGTSGRKGRSRPRLAGALQAVRRVVAVLLVIGGILYGVVTPVRGWVNERVVAAKQRVESVIHPQYVPANPVEVTASTAIKGHPGAAAGDGFTNTFWAAPVAKQPALVLRFDRPVELRRALIRVGVSGNFQGSNRPQTLHVVYSTGASQDLSLVDTPDAQEVKLKSGGKVSVVELHVTSVFRSVRSDAVAITEVELFSRK